jgi:hypothetical protein
MNPALRNIILAPQGIVKRGLVAWYDFTDPAGSQVLTDKSGYGNHGQNGSAVGADTNDVTFDGVKAVFGEDDYIGFSTPLISGKEFTIQTIVNFTGTSTLSGLLQQYLNVTSSGRFFWGRNNTSKLFRLRIGDEFIESKNIIQNNKLYILTVSRNADNFVKLYLGNVVDATGTITGTPDNVNTRMGLSEAINQAMIGSVYANMVYNLALSDAEVKRNSSILSKQMTQRGIAI